MEIRDMVTIVLMPCDGRQLSFTTDSPREAAVWMLRTALKADLFRNMNPANPLRIIDFYPMEPLSPAEFGALKRRWIAALRMEVDE